VREDQLLEERGKKCMLEQQTERKKLLLFRDKFRYSQNIFISITAKDPLANPM